MTTLLMMMMHHCLRGLWDENECIFVYDLYTLHVWVDNNDDETSVLVHYYLTVL